MADESPEQPEGPGPVHYQISITGRQAGVFFLLLLFALGLAFFFGMKTGAAARKGGDAVSQIAGVSDLPVPTVTAEEKGEKPVPTPEPVEKKLGFEDAGPSAAASANATAPTATTGAATTTATPVPPAPTPAPTKPPAPEKSGKAEKPAASGKQVFHVQVLATKDGKKADDWVKKLKKEGFKADVAPSPKSEGLFAVRVGPFPDKARADAQRKKILKANPGLKGLMVVPS